MRLRHEKTLVAGLLGLAMAAGPALAQDGKEAIPAHDVVPSKDQTGVVHVSAMKNPRIHAYRSISAGMDKFDDEHAALAPAVPKLLFQVLANNRAPLGGEAPTATLSADEFSLPLALDGTYRFEVPRSQAAWDAKAELVLSRKRKEARVWPYVRTPGLLENQRRLGDLRLECQVMIAIAKEEAPTWIILMVNGIIMTRDWCGFMTLEHGGYDVEMPAKLASATLRDGERTLALEVEGRRFRAPVGDKEWHHDAIVEVAYAPSEESAPAAKEAP